MALSGHMKRVMMFENREGHYWQGSARLRLGMIRLRAADGPEKLERFWQMCQWARPSKEVIEIIHKEGCWYVALKKKGCV